MLSMRVFPRLGKLRDHWLGTREARSDQPRTRGTGRARRRSVALSVEMLECRVNPTGTNSWTGLSSLDWSDAGNWSLNRAAEACDDLVFDADAPVASRNNNNIVGLSLNSITIQSNNYVF